MRRRSFIAGLLGGAAVRTTWAQQPSKVYRIAFVNPATPVAELTEAGGLRFVRAFFEELRRRGYVEGKNLEVERYSGGGRAERYPELVRDVVRSNPDVIYCDTSRLALSFKAATTTIPIVTSTADPVALGIVASLSHPDGNITGISVDAGIGIWGKRVELLKEADPKASRVGFLATRAVWEQQGAVVREAIERDGMSVVGPALDTPLTDAGYRRVLAAMAQEGADALIVHDQPENLTNRRLICDLAEKGGLPAVYPYSEFVNFGGLMAYAVDLPDIYRHAAGQIDLILKGSKPGDIPFYQASKFELVINLKTARALGLTIPPSLLVRADEVIE